MTEDFQRKKHETRLDMTEEEYRVYNGWDSSTEDEALLLIDIMKSHPSVRWRDMLEKAESHRIKHWQLLLQNSDYIYESIAEAVANSDGLTSIVNKEKNEKG